MDKMSLDALNNHLFETIEMLKNNTDRKASKNEKIDVDTAKVIAEIGRVVVEGYKVKANVLQSLAKTDNPNTMKQVIGTLGMLTEGHK